MCPSFPGFPSEEFSPGGSGCTWRSLEPPDEADDVTQQAQDDDLGVSHLVIQETLKEREKKQNKTNTNQTPKKKTNKQQTATNKAVTLIPSIKPLRAI